MHDASICSLLRSPFRTSRWQDKERTPSGSVVAPFSPNMAEAHISANRSLGGVRSICISAAASTYSEKGVSHRFSGWVEEDSRSTRGLSRIRGFRVEVKVPALSKIVYRSQRLSPVSANGSFLLFRMSIRCASSPCNVLKFLHVITTVEVVNDVPCTIVFYECYMVSMIQIFPS